MKKLMKTMLFLIVLFSLISDFCFGRNSDAEIAYYNNPDTISNRQQSQNEDSVELQGGTKIIFSDIEHARKYMTTIDEYIKSLSPFDIRIRMASDKDVSPKEYMEHISDNVLPWTQSDKIRIKAILQNIANNLKDYDLNLPLRILLIKTTGKEQGQVAYCRGNAIIIPKNILD